MKPASFEYHRPETLDGALGLLAANRGEAALLAGGQSLVPMMNMRLARPAHLIDINRIGGLDGVRLEHGTLEIGALIRHQDLAGHAEVRRHCPLLAHAASTIGHYAIRQRGTLGGSLAIADPSAQLPLVAALLGAEIVLRSQRGERRLPADEFLIAAMTTEMSDDEMLTAVRFPALAEDERWGFELFARRAGDYAVVLAATTLARDARGALASIRLALGGIASAPVVLSDRLAGHLGSVPDAGWPERIAGEIADGIEPEAGGKADEDYKRDLACALVARALGAALGSREGVAA